MRATICAWSAATNPGNPDIGLRIPLAKRRTSTVAVLERRVIHVMDHSDPAFMAEFPDAMTRRPIASLSVPLLHEGQAIGTFTVSRDRALPYSPQQIALIETFADQAAIAIENTRLFEELQAKSQQLEIASQHKSQFLANMTHELRTPLNAIIGYSEMLQEEAEDLDQETLIPDLQKVNAAGKHLLGLINDILDLSKIEAGRMDLFLETFEVGQLVRDVEAIVQPLVEKNGNTLVVECPDDIGTMHADLTKVRQALFNLLSNAAKFTDHGTISLTVAARAGRLAHLRRLGHRHRDDRGAAWAAVRGVLPGRGQHPEHVRRDRAGAGDQPPLLPPDGRRPDRRERLRPGLDVHGAAAKRGWLHFTSTHEVPSTGAPSSS